MTRTQASKFFSERESSSDSSCDLDFGEDHGASQAEVEDSTESQLPNLLRAENGPVYYYPTTEAERKTYRKPSGKRVTPHQWDVYDFVSKLPKGKVCTYKDICDAIGGSPRSVGGALRENPFAPGIPCHRVIASSRYIGGLKGEWGPQGKTGTWVNQKLELLEYEGVRFTKNGYLKDSTFLWRAS